MRGKTVVLVIMLVVAGLLLDSRVLIAAQADTYRTAVLADTPLAYWRLDEASGTTVTDSSGVNLHGTRVNGGTLGAPGAFPDGSNTAQEFAGGANGPHIALPQGFGNFTNGLTLEAWIRPTGAGGSDIINLGSGGSTKVIRLGRGGGDLYFQIYNAHNDQWWLSAPGAVQLGVWQHVAVTMVKTDAVNNWGLARIYVNGLLVANKTMRIPSNVWRTQNFLAKSYYTTETWTGGLDEVAIYTSALSEARIQAHFVASGRALPTAPAASAYQGAVGCGRTGPEPHCQPGDNPLAYWRLDEQAAAGQPEPTVAWDLTNKTNNGLLVGSVTRGAAGALTNETNPAMEFPGGANGPYVQLQEGYGNFTNGLTFEAWIRPTGTGGSDIINLGSGSYNSVVRLGRGGTDLYFQIYNAHNDQWWLSAPSAVQLGVWQHVAVSLVKTDPQTNMGVATFYVNGLRVANQTMRLPSNVWRTQNFLGKSYYTTETWAGGLDEVAIYPTALSEARIQAHYVASGRQLPAGAVNSAVQEAITRSGPLAYWRLGEKAAAGQPEPTVAWDLTNNGHNGLLVGPVTRGLAGAPVGDSDTAMGFSGGENGPHMPIPWMGGTFTNGLTFAAWIYPTAGSGSDIINLGNGGYNSVVRLGRDGNNLFFNVYNAWNNDWWVTAPNVVQFNTWQHVVVTLENTTPATNMGTATIYVNGQAAVTGPARMPTVVTRTQNYLGKSYYTTNTWSGRLDEVAIFAQALSPAQVRAHYAGAGYETLTSTLYDLLHDCGHCVVWTLLAGDPVNVLGGNYLDQQVDLAFPGPGVPIGLIRSYNSAELTDVGFGLGWTYPYALSVLRESPTATAVIVRGPDGRRDRYTESGGTYTAPPGIDSTLVKHADDTWTLTTRAQLIATFDAAGRLTSLKDQAGTTTLLTRTATTLTIADPAGRSVTLTLGTGANAGRFVGATEGGAGGRTVQYAYTNGRLTGVTDVRGGLTTLVYDANQRLSEILLPGGQRKIKNTYDAQGRVIEQRDAADNLTTLAYDTVNRKTTRTDPTGKAVTYTYDTSRRVPIVQDGLANTTTTTYNSANKPICVTDARGGKTAYEYDARGNVLTIIDATNTDANCQLKAGGAKQSFTYSAKNELLTATDELGRVTTLTYDAKGNVLTVTNALNQTTTFNYTTITLASGVSLDVRASETDALGRVTSFTYSNLGQLLSVTRPLGQITQFEYDAKGRLTRTIDPGGIAECREYDNANLLTAVVANCVAGGAVTSSQNVRTEYGYDAAGRQLWQKNPTGEVTRTFYTAQGWVDKVVAGCTVGGVPSTSNCDAFTPATPHRNRVTSYSYDASGRQLTTTDALGVVTRTEYDAAGRAFRTTRNYVAGGPTNATTNVATTTEFYPDGRIKATIDPLGRRTERRYDAAGRTTEVIQNYVDGDPTTGSADSDRITRTEYDAAGNVTATIAQYIDGVWNGSAPDQDARVVTQYDALNRPITTIASYVDGVAGGGEVDTDRISQIQFDAAGNRTVAIDPLGRVTVTVYDALNRASEEIRNCTDGAGTPRTSNCATGHGAANDENVRVTLTYTARSQLEVQTDPLGRRIKIVYDGLGRVTQTIANESGTVAPANVATSTSYDAASRPLTRTDALGKVWTSAFNSAGWLTAQTDPTSRAVTLGYDGLGRPISSTDALNLQRRTLYDALGRPVQTIVNYQDGVVDGSDGTDRDLITQTEYDAAGRRTAIVEPDGQRTTFAYDGLDRLVGVTENVGGATTPANVTTSYSYDRRGLLTQITDARGNTKGRGYNAAGWQTTSTDGLGRTTTTSYDRGGRRLSVADPRPMTVTSAYDGLDRLVGITAPGLTAINLSYDLGGRRTAMTDETGTTTYGYDGLDRLTAATHSVTGTVSHGYDLAGQRTSLTTDTGAPAVTYAYDDAGRLTSVQRAGTAHANAIYDVAGRLQTLTRANGLSTTYTRDNADRLTRLLTTSGGTTQTDFTVTLTRAGQVSGASETIGGTSRDIAYSYDGLRRLTGATETPGTSYGYSYDLVGNRTGATVNGNSIGNWSHDAADQVVGWTYDGAGNRLSDGTQTTTFDPLGRLASVTQAGITISYGSTGDGVLGLQTTGGVTTRYTLDTVAGLPERLGATAEGASTWYVRSFGIELSREQAGASTWFVTDRLASVRAEYTGSGTLTTSLSYDPYGLPQGTSPPTDYGFTGEPQVAGLGLVHLRARWYVPGTGKFLSRDPFAGILSEPGSLHPYSYAHNNPARFTDPSGECIYAGMDDLGQPIWDCSQLEVIYWTTLAIVQSFAESSNERWQDLCSNEQVRLALDFFASGQAMTGALGGGYRRPGPVSVRGILQRGFPLGFKSLGHFRQFGQALKAGLARQGIRDADVGIQGSAVTGRSATTGQPFDTGRVSDYDVAVASPTLLKRAQQQGVDIRGDGLRTRPLTNSDITRLGLSEVRDRLIRLADGREVNLMIFANKEVAATRGPTIWVP